MASSWLNGVVPRQQPYSLRIQGMWRGLDLMVSRASRSSAVRDYAPSVIPSSISLDSSADDLGGTLTFEVLQDKTPAQGPWWSRDLLPDNALITFSQNRSVDGTYAPQTRLFTGFVDNIDARLLGGGTGSLATVTCVSLTSILDRILVRKVADRRTGLALSKAVIKTGTDRDQIREILAIAGGRRRVGNATIFNPTNIALVEETATNLPQLEIQLGTLRQALEAVCESAQNKDGKRRHFYLDSRTGKLVYGFADASEVTYADAPLELVTDPADQELDAPVDFGHDEWLRSSGRLALYLNPLNTGNGTVRNTGARNVAIQESVLISGTGLFTPSFVPKPITSEANSNAIVLRSAQTDSGGTIGTNSARYFRTPSKGSLVGSKFTLSGWFRNNTEDQATQPATGNSYYFIDSMVGASGFGIRLEDVTGVVPPVIPPTRFMRVHLARAGVNVISSSAGGIVNGAWHHIAATFDGTTAKLFVDGALVGSAAWAPINPDTEIRIGAMLGVTDAFPGAYAHLAIHSEALTDGEIQGLYNAGSWTRATSKIIPRDLFVGTDHSRVVKRVFVLAADTSADKDEDQDPYMRDYAAVLNEAGTATAYTKRSASIVFEDVLEAPYIRTRKTAARKTRIDRAARSFFGERRQPEQSVTATIRGASDTQAWWAYGFNSGWRQSGSTYSFVREGWRPGQWVKIDAPALGLVGLYRIASVSMSLEPNSLIRRFDLELDARPRYRIGRLAAMD